MPSCKSGLFVQAMQSMPPQLTTAIIDQLPITCVLHLPLELLCFWLRCRYPISLDSRPWQLDSCSLQALLRALPCIQDCEQLALDLSSAPSMGAELLNDNACNFEQEISTSSVPSMCDMCRSAWHGPNTQLGPKRARSPSATQVALPSQPAEKRIREPGAGVALALGAELHQVAVEDTAASKKAAPFDASGHGIIDSLSAAFTQLLKLQSVALCNVPARSWEDLSALRRVLRCIAGVSHLHLTLAPPTEAFTAPPCYGVAVLQMVSTFPALQVLDLRGFGMTISTGVLQALVDSTVTCIVADNGLDGKQVPEALKHKVHVEGGSVERQALDQGSGLRAGRKIAHVNI